MQFPLRALTDQYISKSYQDVLQQYPSSSLYYILDGLGNVVATLNSSSVGDLLITSNMTASMSVASASYATSASYEIIHEASSSYADTSSVAFTSIFSDTASVAILAYMADTASLAAEAISASYAPSVPSDIAISASWASSSISASYVPNLYPQTEQISASWASSSLSSSYAVSASWAPSTSTSTPTGRPLLTASLDYYVHPTGSNTNNGYSWSSPFSTIQTALNSASVWDYNNNNINIYLANGTYSGSTPSSAVATLVPAVGLSAPTQLNIIGNVSSPSSVLLSGSANVAIGAPANTYATIRGAKLESGANNCIRAADGGYLILSSSVSFGKSAFYHIYTTYGGFVRSSSGYSISGSADRHFYAQFGGKIQVNNCTVTSMAGLNFATAFAFADVLSIIGAYSITWATGSTTGKRYWIQSNAVCQTFGASATYFPGNVAGEVVGGGLYI